MCISRNERQIETYRWRCVGHTHARKEQEANRAGSIESTTVGKREQICALRRARGGGAQNQWESESERERVRERANEQVSESPRVCELRRRR
jgi:hypothetical protein